MEVDKKVLNAAKVAFFIYIVLSPFIPYKPIEFMNHTLFKVLFLILIVITSFVDLQLAIIMTLAFLILIINLNRDVVFGVKHKPPPVSEHFAVNLPLIDPKTETAVNFPDRCDNFEEDRNRISQDLYDLYIDPKIKPYEEYIRALSNPQLIEQASEGALYM